MSKVVDECIPSNPEEDPVLPMIGVGREIWEKEDGDTFIRRLRDESTFASVRGSDIR
jgi:hypothetical protein